ncbi:unnamed protein product [Leptidea sinapis]|uniref:STPR domain-containing protein n=1 Tax=Leptidea sinapis TaxID=189913 RepID=A0A5E4PQV2_9NEOP|nr:unnamed protein product [Leptidea sinapis]
MEHSEALLSCNLITESNLQIDEAVNKSSKSCYFKPGETEEQRLKRLDYLRRHASLKRATETPEEREERLQYLRRRAIERRSTETLEERQKRLNSTRQRAAERRATESIEEREKRLQYLRERAALRRATEDSEARQKRLENTRTYNARRRAEARKAKETLMKIVWNGKLRPRKPMDDGKAIFSHSNEKEVEIEVQPDYSCYNDNEADIKSSILEIKVEECDPDEPNFDPLEARGTGSTN